MPLYDEIENIIRDYYKLKPHFNPNSAIMDEFPKMLLMSIVCQFEVHIKTQLSQIITKVDSGTLTSLPNISMLGNTKRNSDYLYGGFYTFNKRLQIEELSSQRFYSFFGGHAFEDAVKNKFIDKRNNEQIDLEDEINMLYDLASKNSEYEEKWIEKVDEKDTLINLNFEESERSFLCLKLRRNRLAHDYINGLSDTFEGINLFYRKAQVYVLALHDCLSNFL